MDWKDLAGKLVKAGAPIIGTAIGGPFGGMIGGALGSVLASALGTDATPEAINDVLDNTPADVLAGKLSAAEAEAAAKWPALAEIAKAEAEDRTAQSRAINKTVQEELGKVSWYHWRHLLGYAVFAWVVCPLPIILYHMAVGNLTVLNGVVAALVSLIPLIGIAAALNGYVAGDTTRQKIAAATGEAPPTMTETIKAVAKKVVRR